jgi:DNA-binding protein HU-beta
MRGVEWALCIPAEGLKCRGLKGVRRVNKGDLVDLVAERTGFTKKLDAVFSAISSALAKGDKVSLVGFGSFEVRARRARQGRNPQTGRSLPIAARKVPVFRAGKPLKESVND